MPENDVTLSGAHLVSALVSPAGGGAAVTLAAVAQQAAGAHVHPDAQYIVETDIPISGFMDGNEKLKLSQITAGAEPNVFRLSVGAGNTLIDPTPIWSGTVTQYNALTPDSETLYFVSAGVVTVAETIRAIIPITAAGDYRLFDVNFAGTIFRVTDVALLGGTAPTATVTLKLDAVAVTGISVAATSTPSGDSVATALNTFVSRTVVNATLASVTGSPTSLDITVQFTKQVT